MHRDSVGSEQAIRPGEVNWMTAGRGITHSERFERARREGGFMNGIQAWVALPNEHEEAEPAFAHYGTDDLPIFEEPGVWMRLLAGEAFGKTSVPTHSPLSYVHCRIAEGARLLLPEQFSERAAYIVSGAVDVDGLSFSAGRMLVFRPHAPVLFTATETAVMMLLAGEPVGERFIEWNFVSSSKHRIQQAKADWAQGRMKLPDLDNGEFIPLPADPISPPNPMS
jgi:redox-sensitive bicupin YhaK (pirin superfamily)